MGHFECRVVGFGFSEQEAHRDAASKGPMVTGFSDASYRETLKTKMIQAPMTGKVKISKDLPSPTDAKPVWKKRWVVLAGERVVHSAEKRAHAVQWAKNEILRFRHQLDVTQRYVLVSGKPKRYVVTMDQAPGKWEFVMDFHA